MTHYLLQVAYTPESWAALVQNPHSRAEEVRPVVARLGGSLENLWVSFGDYDVVALLQLPDNVSAAAFSIAISAGGAVKAVRTTPLLDMEESTEAMSKAGAAGYKAPKWVRTIRGENVRSEG